MSQRWKDVKRNSQCQILERVMLGNGRNRKWRNLPSAEEEYMNTLGSEHVRHSLLLIGPNVLPSKIPGGLGARVPRNDGAFPMENH